jgi:hypothetical protein
VAAQFGVDAIFEADVELTSGVPACTGGVLRPVVCALGAFSESLVCFG